jgi:hypothetical protein
MRRIVLICAAAAAVVTAGAVAPSGADAMPVASSALASALREEPLAEKVAYYCRPVWRCGYYGCGWRRACAWAPGPYAYGFYRPYRPYWAWRWRHRYW